MIFLIANTERLNCYGMAWLLKEHYPNEQEWGIVKVFHTKAKAEEHKQSLETYEKML